MKSWWRRLLETNRSPQEPNGECPVCHSPVVLSPNIMRGSWPMGAMAAPQTREEAIAACIEHGRSPFNDMTRRFVETD